MLLSLLLFLALLGVLPEPLGNHGLWSAMLLFMAARGVTLGVRWPRHAASIGA